MPEPTTASIADAGRCPWCGGAGFPPRSEARFALVADSPDDATHRVPGIPGGGQVVAPRVPARRVYSRMCPTCGYLALFA